MSKVRDNNVTKLNDLFKENISNAYTEKDEKLITKYEASLNNTDSSNEFFTVADGEIHNEIYNGFYQEDRNENREFIMRYCNELFRCVTDSVSSNDPFTLRKNADTIYVASISGINHIKVKNFFTSGSSSKNILREVAWFVVHSYVSTYFMSVDNMYKMMPILNGDAIIKWNNAIDDMDDISADVKNYFKMNDCGISEFQSEYAAKHNMYLVTNSSYNIYTINKMKNYKNTDGFIQRIVANHEKAEKVRGDIATAFASVSPSYRNIYGKKVASTGFSRKNTSMSSEEIRNIINMSRGKKTEEVVENANDIAEEIRPEEPKTETEEKKPEVKEVKKEKSKDIVETVRKNAHANNPAVAAFTAETILPPADPDEVKVDPAELEHPQDDLEDAVVPEEVVDVPFEETKTEETPKQETSTEPSINASEKEVVNIPASAYENNNIGYHKALPGLEKFTQICNKLGYHVFYEGSDKYKGLLNAILVNNKFNTVYKRLMVDPRLVYGNGIRIVTNTNKDGDIRKEMFIPVENKVLLQKLVKNDITAEDRKAFNEKLPRCLNDFRNEYAFLDRVDLSNANTFLGKELSFGEWKGLVINISKVLTDKELPLCRYRVADVKAPDNFKLICDSNSYCVYENKLIETDSHKAACDKMFVVIYDPKQYGNDTPYACGHVTAAA